MNENLNDHQRIAWERRCLERARKGELEAFGELYRAYAPVVYSRVLLPRLGDVSTAEDALADTFRSAMERLATFQSREVSVCFWFMRIAENKVRDLHRSRRVSGRRLMDLEQLLIPLVGPPDDPEALCRLREDSSALEQRIADCLKAILPRYERAIRLRIFEERPRSECAIALGLTLGTFDVLLLRALRSFQKAWEAARVQSLETTHVA